MDNLIVIKIGGNSINTLPPSFFSQIRQWMLAKKRILLIHGGGSQISELSDKLKIPVKKIDGMRITDKSTLELTRMVLLGQTQPQLLMKFTEAKIPAIGLNAADESILNGTFLDEQKYGLVGQIDSLNIKLLSEVLTHHLAILAPMALTADNQWLNVNADTAASKIAGLLKAEKLYLLTDVPGVLHNNTIIPSLSPKIADLLQSQNIITAGMKPKIQAAFNALNWGVTSVQITNQLASSGTTFVQEGDNENAISF
ncbi:acetylglutamate kinase [Liquorilactobacillus cacaonum]|uniref:Acetylglutamate kinase n=1 Tax=Liquorilactobacillus cacaonum DSM 21116 TaxID=1423729 RepID=A0A0R2CVJ9_9LACO|nr:acetylglutamate kinase [Liquorilactobacillus cacaonum]KRM92105.1 acetylglutamate kinase [Liquorilactobacillus cacaonum DSM 21116]